ncbi:C40 family peptidase [Fulvivirga sedimenti]|uniref:C40 family peptidase n=1 Tax=Fulvivirga sedimenti TaxID=2879465 RepID=A0A9X1HP16_9BACT|nr:C40 family peptidase [Fulvivirga sedimenti]MCA6075191.1 C40 family peptidase [Fulvivirga sedimenti]MCA6076368.1 C40 family peptidase [Fulvivirga sedimenti]MCA6077496.1 C40 family peptidase [Fulvivirga sedimenti]
MITTGTKGICRLALMPVRAAAADTSEQVTQLLFGEHYEILEISKNQKWFRIRINYDGYEGWVDHRQHTTISDAYYDQINISNYKVCLELTTTILYQKQALQILIGSVLPISTNEIFKMEEQLAFNGDAKGLGQRMGYEYLRNVALKYLNSPYMWGGRSPFGIDCSGFTQIIYRIAGYSLLRDASQQATQGREIKNLSEARPGDLAFFKNDSGKIYHVGMIMEDRQIIHASGRVRIDQLDEQGIRVESSGEYTHFLSSIRRILKN